MPVLPVERQGRALRDHALEIAGHLGHLALGSGSASTLMPGGQPHDHGPFTLVCGTKGRGPPAFRHAPLTDTRPVHTVRPRSAGRPEQRSPEPALRSYRDIYVTMRQRVTHYRCTGAQYAVSVRTVSVTASTVGITCCSSTSANGSGTQAAATRRTGASSSSNPSSA